MVYQLITVTQTSTDQTTGRGGYDYGNVASDINPDDIGQLTYLLGCCDRALRFSCSNGVVMIVMKKR
jgi:hypothetical protein